MSKTVTILTAVLAVQLILFAVVSRDPHHVSEKKSFLSLDTSKVESIKIRNTSGEVTLKKSGLQWRLTQPVDFPANPSYVQTLIEKLAELQVETVVTKSEDKHQLYELDELGGIAVEVGVSGGKTQSFICGKMSETYSHVFLRRADSKEVIMAAGSPRSSLTREPSDWRDKRIVEIDRTMIERVVIQTPAERNELVRRIKRVQEDTTIAANDTSWVVNPSKGSPFTPVETALNRVMNALKRLNAIEFLDEGKDAIPDFSTPDLTVEAFLEDGRRYRLDFIPQADSDSRWVCRKEGEDKTVFIVYQSSVNNLRKTAAELKGEDSADKKKAA